MSASFNTAFGGPYISKIDIVFFFIFKLFHLRKQGNKVTNTLS